MDVSNIDIGINMCLCVEINKIQVYSGKKKSGLHSFSLTSAQPEVESPVSLLNCRINLCGNKIGRENEALIHTKGRNEYIYIYIYIYKERNYAIV